MTRDPVPCTRNGEQRACGEVRQISRSSEDAAGSPEVFTLYQGSTEKDTRLDAVSDLLYLGQAASDETVQERGPIAVALAPWQVAPPNHGATFVRYQWAEDVDTSTTSDGQDGEQTASKASRITTDLWIDERTRMPLRIRSVDSNGEPTDTRYWSYEKQRLEDSQLPTGYFHVAEPSSAEQDKRVYYYDGDQPPSQFDPETGRTYRSYWIGTSPLVAGQRFCLAATALEGMTEALDDPIPRTQSVNPRVLWPADGRDDQPDTRGVQLSSSRWYVHSGRRPVGPSTYSSYDSSDEHASGGLAGDI